MARPTTALTELARLGFANLRRSHVTMETFSASLLPHFAHAADPDQALDLLEKIRAAAPADLERVLSDNAAAARLISVLGASLGLGEFFLRRPAELSAIALGIHQPPRTAEYRADLLSAVVGRVEEDAWVALRVRYRWHLAQLTAWDLAHPDPLAAVSVVGQALADLAGAALDAALDVARRMVQFPPSEVAATELSIIGMGKSGARELNYVSDVDVIFVAGPSRDREGAAVISNDRAVDIATRLAVLTMRGVHELAVEPELWEVDANLRPEGKDGALVRTLESHSAYYERWAKSWEFQALLKARPLAGNMVLGNRYMDAITPHVWSSASREGFVGSVQRMRERVTDNIPADTVDLQLKLGPGGLRDVEFTIQLLQLVHGQTDSRVRQEATLPALAALADEGYIGRAESAEFSRDYRFLRLLEHRLQLSKLQRTHLMPTDPEALRILARSTGIASSAADLTQQWKATKVAVRRLHERLFYRPLLSAVAALPDGDLTLSSAQATARLAAIGFRDPDGALRHIAALTNGVSRRASIQRNLLPVMLQWFAEGVDPDHGLLVFRRLSDDLGETYWFLRMLRDSSGAARRLTEVLSGSRFVGDLFERIPEAAAWLENDEELRPRSLATLLEESRAILQRHAEDPDSAALALRTARRREILRLAIGGILEKISVQELGTALSDVTTALLTGVLGIAHRPGDGIQFAIIAMGRYGGQEMGFGSDVDLMYVYSTVGTSDSESQSRAESIVKAISQYTEDLQIPLDLDIGLRPEGKNGAVVRSIDSYRAYYARWSLTWEAQALLRSRAVAGDDALRAEFESLADEMRFPELISDQAVREIKRIKARVESERLPQAADPTRHVKLGRGSLSDVEWLVQLLQLRHGATVSGLRTTSTLTALSEAQDAGLIGRNDAIKLRNAWLLASRLRSAMTLWSSRTTDVLPTDRHQLDGVARLLKYPPGSAAVMEDDYLRTTRLARVVFEKLFYGGRETPGG